MKKRFTKFLGMVMIASLFALGSCDFLEDCGTCTQITEKSDGTVEEGEPILVCGDLYHDYLNSSPVTAFGETTYWVCE